MNITVITELFLHGGLETQILGYCKHMLKAGHQISLVAGERSDISKIKSILDDRVLIVPISPDQTGQEVYQTSARIRDFVLEQQSEILHIHPFVSFLSGVLAAALVQKPFVLTLHGPVNLSRKYGVGYIEWLSKIAFRDAYHVYCVSSELKYAASQLTSEARFTVLPNGVNINKFKPAKVFPENPWAIIARLDRDKIPGIQRFILQFKEVSGSQGRLDIFGDGDSMVAMSQWLSELSFSGHVRLMGYCDEMETALFQGYAGAIGMGRIILEAGAMSLPVILCGYDGPKILLEAGHLNELQNYNFSGRGIATMTTEDLRSALLSAKANKKKHNLRPWISKNANESLIWDKYIQDLKNIPINVNYDWADIVSDLMLNANSGPFLASFSTQHFFKNDWMGNENSQQSSSEVNIQCPENKSQIMSNNEKQKVDHLFFEYDSKTEENPKDIHSVSEQQYGQVTLLLAEKETLHVRIQELTARLISKESEIQSLLLASQEKETCFADLQGTVQQLKRKLLNKERKLSQLEEEVRIVSLQLAQKEGSLKSITIEFDGLRKQNCELLEDITIKKQQLVELAMLLESSKQEIQSFSSKALKTDSEFAATLQKLTAVEKALELSESRNKESLEYLNKITEETSRKYESYESLLQERDARTKKLSFEYDKCLEQIADQQKNLMEGASDIKRYREEIYNLEQKLTVTSQSLAQFAEAARQHENIMTKLRRDYNETQKDLGCKSDQLQQYEAMVKSLKTELEIVKSETQRIKSQTVTKEKEVSQLKQVITSLHLEQARQYHSLTESDAWQLMQILWRVRRLFIPRGSLREKIAVQVKKFIARRLHWISQILNIENTRLAPPSSYDPEEQSAVSENTGNLPAITMTDTLVAKTPELLEKESDESVLWKHQQSLTVKKNTAFFDFDLRSLQTEQREMVSIILPVFNQADMLRDAVRHVLAQTWQNFELIIINDGSTDEIDQVFSDLAGHPKIRLLSQVNQKLPKALSNGFEFARGEYWTWTSADNLMHADQLEKQVTFLKHNPSVAMVYADYLAIDDRGEFLKDPDWRPHNKRNPLSPEIRLPRTTESLNKVQDNFIGPCFMYRRWVGKLIGEYAPELGVEDYDYWMRINLLFTISHIGTDDLLYKYRVHDNSLSGHARELRILERVQKLMVYEKNRADYFKQPWVLYVDRITLGYLENSEIKVPDALIIDEMESGHFIQGKLLFIVSPHTLPLIAEQDLPADSCVAVWFDSNSLIPYQYRLWLSRLMPVCFAVDKMTEKRLSLLGQTAFICSSWSEAFDLTTAYANNHTFYRKTYSSIDCQRNLPEVYHPENHRYNVLIQVDGFAQGGLEQVVLDLAISLDKNIFNVKLLILGEEGEAAEVARKQGLQVLRLSKQKDPTAYQQLLKDQKVSLVNAHHSLFGAQECRQMKVPFVQTVHNTYVWLSREQRKNYKDTDAFTTAYICVSKNVACYSDLQLGLDVEKMVVIPNGISLEQFNEINPAMSRRQIREILGVSSEDFLFLNVASIYPPKSQLYIVRAIRKIITECPQAKVVFLGRIMDKPYHKRILKEIEKYNLEDVVLFAGYDENSVPWYQAADVFLLPSFWEGWSLALAEALAAGLPVISTDVGGAADVIAEAGGYLIPPPFKAISELDEINMWQYIDGEQSEFTDSIAGAMKEVYNKHSKVNISDNFRDSIDRNNAYRSCSYLFQWLIQHGSPSEARAWMKKKRISESAQVIRREHF
jgi:glycosyltransferase involved in cell wall biosynthesis